MGLNSGYLLRSFLLYLYSIGSGIKFKRWGNTTKKVLREARKNDSYFELHNYSTCHFPTKECHGDKPLSLASQTTHQSPKIIITILSSYFLATKTKSRASTAPRAFNKLCYCCYYNYYYQCFTTTECQHRFKWSIWSTWTTQSWWHG